MMTAMQQRSTDLSQRRQDALAGAKPALYLALGLGAVTGGSVVIVMIVGALLLGSIGGIGSGASGFFALIGVSIAFWLGISFGVILGVTAGFRAWTALYPAYERREEAAEKRAALVEVELLLQGPENNRPPEDHTTG
jgi:hypothetical protein